MEFDFTTLPARDRYALMTGAVVPRPIALVTSLNADGIVNAAPFSFFNCVGSDPPLVVLGIGDRVPGVPKDTAANIRLHGEFVVNIVDESIAEAMNLTATEFPADVSEVPAVGFTTAPSLRVRVPRIVESPIHLECTEVSTIEIGRNRIVLGQVVQMHVKDDLLTAQNRIRPGALQAVGRMQSPSAYTRTRDQFDLERVTYADFLKRFGDGA